MFVFEIESYAKLIDFNLNVFTYKTKYFSIL